MATEDCVTNLDVLALKDNFCPFWINFPHLHVEAKGRLVLH